MDGHSNNGGHGIPNYSEEEWDRLRKASDEHIAKYGHPEPLTMEEIGRVMMAKLKEPIKSGWDKHIKTIEVDG